MKMLTKIINSLDSVKAPIWVDFVRIAVGLFIIYKGVIFTNNFEGFTSNIQSVGWIYIASHLSIGIIFIHLVCGIILVLGAYTRWMSLLNLPILIGAVVFNIKRISMVDDYIELEMAIIISLLLMVIIYFGSGKLSLENRRKS